MLTNVVKEGDLCCFLLKTSNIGFLFPGRKPHRTAHYKGLSQNMVKRRRNITCYRIAEVGPVSETICHSRPTVEYVVWTISSIRPLCLSIYRLACFLQNQRAIAIFGLSSTTTNLCSSATSPHLTHLWYIVNHYHPRIFNPMICLSSTMSSYFLSILNGNHVMSQSHTVSYYTIL
jgi:hypothetical protein